MKNYLLKAHQERKSGNFNKALKYYLKSMHSRHLTAEQYNTSLYMLAFTYVLIAHQAKNEYYALGADLRQPTVDAYHQANTYLKQLCEAFDPTTLGLPCLTRYEIDEIAKAA
jgi:hypothetical protein